MLQESNAQQYKKEYAEFIDHAAHDLDAPLRKLGVLIERLTQKLGPDQSKEVEGYVQRIHSQLAGMRSIIDSLSGLSHVSAGLEQVESFPVERVIEEAWLELKETVNETGATIHTVKGSLPMVTGDKEQYRTLFRELFSNALKFRKKEETPKIEIDAVAVEDSWQFTVADNGIGFRQEDAEKIFKPFVQLQGKSESGGNGIGLAMCKAITDNHRGTIFATSTEYGGTRIIFILPQTIN
jgi:light-regulated signal transduction histidine kinase (bacteriophytochrome)